MPKETPYSDKYKEKNRNKYDNNNKDDESESYKNKKPESLKKDDSVLHKTEKFIGDEAKKIDSELKAHPVVRKTLIFLAFAIPIAILLIILYLNFLPFGYYDSQTIYVGQEGDTEGAFYLEETEGLGARQMLDGEYFRQLDGVVYAVYEPTAVLTNATINVSLVGENVSFITQPDISEVNWDYEWDAYNYMNYFEVVAPMSVYRQMKDLENSLEANFSKPFKIEINWTAKIHETLIDEGYEGLRLTQDAKEIILEYKDEEIVYELPDFFLDKEHSALVGFSGEDIYLFIDEEFVGKIEDVEEATVKSSEIIKEEIEVRDDCLYFDGNTRLIYPNSSDMFEEGPFAVYVEWVPEKAEDGWQQLIGHFNWEIYQSGDKVRSQIGRMYDDGPMYVISYPLDNEFLNQKNSALAFYNPTRDVNKSGYIEFYVDQNFAGRVEFGNETIWRGYGEEDLSIGWTPHIYGRSPFYEGKICEIKFSYDILEPTIHNSISLNGDGEERIKIPVFGDGEAKLKTVELKALK